MTPRETPGQQREGRHVELKVPFEGDAPRDLQVTAYAFDRRDAIAAPRVATTEQEDL
jgi:hypothetical protein